MPKPAYKLKAIWPTAYYRLKRAIICVTPRAASTSMMTALEFAPRVTQEEAIKLRDEIPSVLWLRDPLERWASAADLFMRNKAWSLDQFVARTFEEENVHWLPQTRIHTSAAGIFVPSIVHQFEHLEETWDRYAPEFPLRRLNVTKARKRWEELSRELSADQVITLCEYYDHDLAERYGL